MRPLAPLAAVLISVCILAHAQNAGTAPVTASPTAAAAIAQPKSVAGDTAPASSSFEVASIRMVDSGAAAGFSISPFPTSLFTATGANLAMAIQFSYGIDNPEHILGKPGWMDSQQYDFSARVEGDRQLSLPEMRPMLQHLLEQRFHLVTHHETQSASGLALVVTKSGAKLQPSKEGTSSHGQISPSGLISWHTDAQHFAEMLAVALHQPVVDKTGLTGTYDIKLSYAPLKNPNPESDLPDIFTAIQDQLGLKLEPAKVPVDYLVIDHVDRVPTDN